MAEREGFEPSIPFWSMHAFQACALNRSAISPPFAGRPAGAKQTGCLISRARLKGKLIPAAGASGDGRIANFTSKTN